MPLVDDTVRISDLTVQVLDVDFPSGREVFKPQRGSRFVIVDVRVENTGERTREITSGLQMDPKDTTGQKSNLHLGAQTLADAGLPDDEHQRGGMVRGKIGFQIPENVPELTFVFDAEIVGFGKGFNRIP